MDTEHLDLLVIGGPQELLAPGSALKIKQVAFSFEGLSGALQYIRLVDTVIVLPEKSIFASMPRIDHFEKFYSTGTRIRIPTPASSSEIENLSEPLLTETTSIPPIFVRLGLASFPLIDQDKEEESISSQVSSSLSLINKSTKKNAQRDFIKRAVSEFLLEVLKISSTLVHGGGKVFVLLPMEEIECTKDLLEVINKIAPGIYVGWLDSWKRRKNDEWSWILSGIKSNMRFWLNDNYYYEMIRSNSRSVPEVLPHPELVFVFLDSDVELHFGSVADRSESKRALVFRWGDGSFVLAPDGALPNIIKRLAENEIADVVPQVTPQLSDGTTPSPGQEIKNVEKKRKRRSAPKIGIENKQKVYKIWNKYKRECAEGKGDYKLRDKPSYAKCSNEKETELMALGVRSEEDLKLICDSCRKH